jgi:hypothetical protein
MSHFYTYHTPFDDLRTGSNTWSTPPRVERSVASAFLHRPIVIFEFVQIHIKSANPYVEPEFDSGFMNNKADFAPIRWSYKKTREVARRMDCMLSLLSESCPPTN